MAKQNSIICPAFFAASSVSLDSCSIITKKVVVRQTTAPMAQAAAKARAHRGIGEEHLRLDSDPLSVVSIWTLQSSQH